MDVIVTPRGILGFHSRDKTATLVYKNNSKMSRKFCIIIESNSQRTFFAIVLYNNMATVTSREKQEELPKLRRPSPSPKVCWDEGRSYGDVINKFSGLDRVPIFLTNGALLARFVLTLRYKSPPKTY